ncbi:MAG: tetratricopeptide repeat protein [Candidatus Thiodiazotropha sp. (ex Notomyrtea botanica)]|nr:tetratricopeptide repeat protein [Candidatus Thiodiazotropha sp. (ex Notomyrtea botanica)]
MTERLVFDDEPLDGILYGTPVSEPTPADCFLPIKAHMQRIHTTLDNHNVAGLISALNAITRNDMALHRPVCDELVHAMGILIPSNPVPLLEKDNASLIPLLEKIWALPYSASEYNRQNAVGNRLHRIYEHQHRYAEARAILTNLTRLAQVKGDQDSEATCYNNKAFDYLLEERYKDAMPLFQSAEQLFFKNNDNFSAANSRANYLTCVFSLRPVRELIDYEAELIELARTLSENNDWRARKSYVLLSRIREFLEDRQMAIDYMRHAINASIDDNLQWTAIDQARLAELEAKP